MNNTIYIKIIMIMALLEVTACRKLLEISPAITKAQASVVYNTQSLATAAVNSIYYDLAGSNIAAGPSSISIYTGLTSDEFISYSSSDISLQQAYLNSLDNINECAMLWIKLYNFIYRTNAAIEGLTVSTELSTNVKEQLLGEAKCMRAFFFFYLVNLYGDVPLITTTNFEINAKMPRTSQDEVYNQIVKDLQESQILLSNIFIGSDLQSPSIERVRPTKWFATALLSRVYLYRNEYSKAIEAATTIIKESELFDTVEVTDVFLKNSKEAIFQLQNIYTTYNTQEAATFLLQVDPSYDQPVSISPQLYDSITDNDKRKQTWIIKQIFNGNTYYSPYKYKVLISNQPVEYSTIIRLAEIYLIRAESKANLNNLPGSLIDLNIIRKRAGLQNFESNDKTEILNSIILERKIEFFSEWGHRWFDLKRTGNINTVMEKITPLKGGTWSSYWQLFPIPLLEIKNNPFLKQNQGY